MLSVSLLSNYGCMYSISETMTGCIYTSISKMHVALDLMGRNSAYSVTLKKKDTSLLIRIQTISVDFKKINEILTTEGPLQCQSPPVPGGRGSTHK